MIHSLKNYKHGESSMLSSAYAVLVCVRMLLGLRREMLESVIEEVEDGFKRIM